MAKLVGGRWLKKKIYEKVLQEQGCSRSEWFVHTDPCSPVFLQHFVQPSRPLSVSVSLSTVYGRRSIVVEFSADVSDGDDITAEHRCMPDTFLNKVVPLCSSPDRWEDQDEERSRHMCQVTQRQVSSIHFIKYLVLGNQKSIHASQITSAPEAGSPGSFLLISLGTGLAPLPL